MAGRRGKSWPDFHGREDVGETCQDRGRQPAEFGVFWGNLEGGRRDRGRLDLRAVSTEDAAAQEGPVQPRPLPRCLSRQARQDHSQSPWPTATENNVSSLSLRNCSWVFGPSHFRTAGCRQPRRGGLGPPRCPGPGQAPMAVGLSLVLGLGGGSWAGGGGARRGESGW